MCERENVQLKKIKIRLIFNDYLSSIILWNFENLNELLLEILKRVNSKIYRNISNVFDSTENAIQR